MWWEQQWPGAINNIDFSPSLSLSSPLWEAALHMLCVALHRPYRHQKKEKGVCRGSNPNPLLVLLSKSIWLSVVPFN